MQSVAQVFSERVDESNARFVAAAERAGARVTEYPHPLPGPHGEPLATWTAQLGPDRPERMLAAISGTHGIEAYAGSAIQVAALDELADAGLPEGLGVLFVHQINPWGCAWNRRENEDNVDIFRNLIYTDRPFAENPRYDRFEEGINPRAWTGPERAHADAIFQDLIDTHGMDGAIDTIRRGQHLYPKGTTYHGDAPSWSRQVVEQIGRDQLAGVPRVLALDIHTGYGAMGEAWIVPFNARGSAKSELICRHYDGQILLVGDDPLIPDHPRPPYEIWETPQGPRVLYVGLEFGTHDVASAFDLFRANTFIHTYGALDGEFGRQTSAAYRELFYPASTAWREDILGKGLEVVRKAIELTRDMDAVL